MKNTLFILRALPGAGKSTLAKILTLDQDYPNWEADMYFINVGGEYTFDINKLSEAHKWCFDRTEESMMADEERIVVSNTFTRESEIQPYLDLADKYSYRIISLIIENRHGNKSIHGLSDEKMELMQKRFEFKLR